MISLDINATTFLIQIAATIALFVVAWRFFAKPMKKFMSDRHAFVQGQFTEAETAKADAKVALDEAKKEIKSAKFEAEKIVEAAKDDATTKGEAITRQAHADAELEMKKAQEEIKRERQNMLETTKKEIATVTTKATEQLIRKEINADVHQNLFDEFVTLVGGSNE